MFNALESVCFQFREYKIVTRFDFNQVMGRFIKSIVLKFVLFCTSFVGLIIFFNNDWGSEDEIYREYWRNEKILKFPDWRSDYFCNVGCISGEPCQYKDEVDLRIVLIVANRPGSLSKSLTKISSIDMMGDRISVDIWIDQLKDGTYHNETKMVAENFAKTFELGRCCVHLQTQHSFIANQWINTYRPKLNTKEVAIILEDDIDLSPMVWRWYKALHDNFRNADDIAGYSLKMQGAFLRSPKKKHILIEGPLNHSIVLYNCFQAWAYSPQPNIWRDFQDWYQNVRKNKTPGNIIDKVDLLEPKVPGSLHYEWWKTFKKKNFQESMAHEMWNIYYTNMVKSNLFTVYSNLLTMTKRQDVLLCNNRMEKGLHYSGSGNGSSSSLLMTHWDPSYIKFPENPFRLSITGNKLN